MTVEASDHDAGGDEGTTASVGVPTRQEALDVVFVLSTVPVVASTVALNSGPVPETDELSGQVL